MTMPALPAQGSTSWYTYAQGLDSAARNAIPATGDSTITGVKTFNGTVVVHESIVTQGYSGNVLPGRRNAFNNYPVIDGSTLTAANLGDKVGMQNSVTFQGGFSGEAASGTPNPGFIWGANDFIITGTTSGDISGITDMQARLTEVHLRVPNSTINNVSGLVAESNVQIEASGATVTGWLASMIARGPKNNSGGTVTVAQATALLVQSPAAGTATLQYALRVEGDGLSKFDGNIEMNADPSAPKTVNAFNGGFIGRSVQVGQPSDLPTGAIFGVKTTSSGEVAAWLQGQGGQSADIFRVGQDSTVQLRVDKNGRLGMRQTFAAADADIPAGELMLHVDSTSGAMKLVLKGKDNGGTIRTGSVTLT